VESSGERRKEDKRNDRKRNRKLRVYTLSCKERTTSNDKDDNEAVDTAGQPRRFRSYTRFAIKAIVKKKTVSRVTLGFLQKLVPAGGPSTPWIGPSVARHCAPSALFAPSCNWRRPLEPLIRVTEETSPISVDSTVSSGLHSLAVSRRRVQGGGMRTASRSVGFERQRPLFDSREMRMAHFGVRLQNDLLAPDCRRRLGRHNVIGVVVWS
jgi:hypothetical protein